MFGGKGNGLILLRDAGIAVPEFITLNNERVIEILESDIAADKLMSEINFSGTVAVRSSADVEDGKTDSFAGVFKSVLDVPIEKSKIIDAIRTVYESAKNSELLGKLDVQMNVVIQRFIKPVIAGVVFSHVYNEQGNTECQISFVHGVGEQLVSGQAKSFDVRFPWDDDKISTDSMVFNGPAQLNHLDDLYKLTNVIEQVCAKTYKFADIEWCMDSDGKIWIVQLRPITKNIFLNNRPNSDFSILAAGAAKGKAYVIPSSQDNDEIKDYVSKCPPDSILVSFWTDTLFLPALNTARATIVRMGSIMSHSAIIAREKNIPCLLINKKIWDEIKTGTEIEIDTYANTLTVDGTVYSTTEIGTQSRLGDLHLFDNAYEVFSGKQTNWFEWTDNGLFMRADVWKDQSAGKEDWDKKTQGLATAQDVLDISLRKMFGTAPKRTNDKYFYYFMVKRWKMMPAFNEFFDKMRDVMVGLHADKIQKFYDDTLSAAKELDARRSTGSELEKLYCTESILGLNALRDNLFPDYAVRYIYQYLFPYLRELNISFDDFAKNDWTHDNAELMRIHKCLITVAECRNTAWTVFLDAPVMGLNEWVELDEKTCKYFGLERTNENVSTCIVRLSCVEYPKLLTGRDEVWDKLWLDYKLAK